MSKRWSWRDVRAAERTSTVARAPDWSDADMLEALHLRGEGLSAREIGQRLGRPRNAVLGALHRIDVAMRETDADGTGNGSMPAEWWRAGLALRAGEVPA